MLERHIETAGAGSHPQPVEPCRGLRPWGREREMILMQLTDTGRRCLSVL
jgi:hypothetical protein